MKRKTNEINLDLIVAQMRDTIKRMSRLEFETNLRNALKYEESYCKALWEDLTTGREITKAETLLRGAYEKENNREVMPIRPLTFSYDDLFLVESIIDGFAKYDCMFQENLKALKKMDLNQYSKLKKSGLKVFVENYNLLLEEKLEDPFYKNFIVLDSSSQMKEKQEN